MNIVLGLASVTIFVLMLTIGVNHSLAQLTSLWHKRDRLFRGWFAALVLVPLVAFILLLVFSLPPAIASGLAILAAAPGAPLTTKRSQMVGADMEYVTSMQLSLALLAVVVTPVLLTLFTAAFSLTIDNVSPLVVAWQIAKVTLLPVVIGLLARQFAPDLVERVSGPLNLFANVLFLLFAATIVGVLIMVPDLRAMLALGWIPAIAIVVLAVSAVAVGHGLGGPVREQRAGLAIACLARNVGLAVYVSGVAGIAQETVPTILTYMILGLVVQIAYSVWVKQQVADSA